MVVLIVKVSLDRNPRPLSLVYHAAQATKQRMEKLCREQAQANQRTVEQTKAATAEEVILAGDTVMVLYARCWPGFPPPRVPGSRFVIHFFLSNEGLPARWLGRGYSGFVEHETLPTRPLWSLVSGHSPGDRLMYIHPMPSVTAVARLCGLMTWGPLR